jgi:hypothetical protein
MAAKFKKIFFLQFRSSAQSFVGLPLTSVITIPIVSFPDTPETPELLKSLLNIRTANSNMSNSVIRYNPKRRHSSAGLPNHLSALLGQYKEYKAPPPGCVTSLQD